MQDAWIPEYCCGKRLSEEDSEALIKVRDSHDDAAFDEFKTLIIDKYSRDI
jgi:hypothetical protein